MTLKRHLILAAAFAIAAQSAHAITANELAAQYQGEGYGYIQIRTGVSQIKVEAIKDGQKVEVIYDAATGAVLKSESERIGTIVNADRGPRLRNVGRDFVDGSDDDADDKDRGRGRDDRSEDDDDDDDDKGRGRGRGRGGDDD